MNIVLGVYAVPLILWTILGQAENQYRYVSLQPHIFRPELLQCSVAVSRVMRDGERLGWATGSTDTKHAFWAENADSLDADQSQKQLAVRAFLFFFFFFSPLPLSPTISWYIKQTLMTSYSSFFSPPALARLSGMWSALIRCTSLKTFSLR